MYYQEVKWVSPIFKFSLDLIPYTHCRNQPDFNHLEINFIAFTIQLMKIYIFRAYIHRQYRFKTEEAMYSFVQKKKKN